ncbi:MAG: tRNA epoxyqueuosine(34) reductase QueG [Flavobacteriaceae bacterium]|nr:tRNA epoxyqueuosine(34) reductase QueG [Flavobacteriaceae bacterium]
MSRNSSNKQKLTNFIKSKSVDLGFISCGISKADFLEEEAANLENWLKNEMHGEMSYMERNFDMRLDPRKILNGAKSVISLTYNYYTDKLQKDENFKISKYAFGTDYHFVIREKLKNLLFLIREKVGDINGRVFVDSAPILERAWAKKSGLGWIGKNTNLISKNVGSFFFLCEIIVDIELDYDYSTTDHCGTCTACIDACPTNAIVEPYKVDGSRCISYLTIELKENMPEYAKDSYDKWIFGCDICQDVCPWNKFSKPHNEPLFNADEKFLSMSKNEWLEITKETFDKVFKDSAVKRTGYDGLKRNIKFIKRG